MDKTTEDLTNEINSITSAKKLEKFLDNNSKEQQTNPIQYLLDTIAKKGIRECDFRKDTQLDSARLSHVMSGSRPLSRELCLVCAIAGKFTSEEANYLLKYSGNKQLYMRDKRDSIIYFCLQNGKNLMDTNFILEELNETIIPAPRK